MIDPIFLRIGGIQIRYYGLIYSLMFLLGTFMIIWISEYKYKKLKIKEYAKLDKNAVFDFMIYLIFGGIMGARLFHIIFYNLSFYLSNPLEVFALWHGGLSFHGGLFGGILVTYYFCRKRKINFYDLADVVTIPFALGLAFGRIGNFINQELYGKITTLPWGVKFDNAEGLRHPTQLYESAKNFFIFGALLFLNRKKRNRGLIFWSFIAMYGTLRLVIEFWKEFPPVLFGLTMGQLLCVPMIVIGAIMIFKTERKGR
jgi:phosphatidylglycerol---prolipoprotein diacylglyceryl transferase